MYRQGDVYLKKLDVLPERALQRPFYEYDETDNPHVEDELISNVLAEGTATGHKHEIVNGTVWRIHPRGLRIWTVVEAGENTTLVHEEHETLQIAPGYYQVVIQREYIERGWAYVYD